MSADWVLLAQLGNLTAGIEDDTLEDALSSLVNHLRATLSSYCGLQLTVTDHGRPVTLTQFSPGSAPPVSSLCVPVAVLVPGLPLGSRVVFFAAAPGALVDLAADLSYALSLPMTTGRSSNDGRSDTRNGRGPAIRLDQDVPSDSLISGLVGLEPLSTINRAVGLLIERGVLPETAHRTLRRGASAAGLDVLAFAAQLLAR